MSLVLMLIQEDAVVTTLDFDLVGKGTHCTHCLRAIAEGEAVQLESDLLEAAYCSTQCQAKSKVQSQNLLFGSEPPLPLELGPALPAEVMEKRGKAQTAFAKYVEE